MEVFFWLISIELEDNSFHKRLNVQRAGENLVGGNPFLLQTCVEQVETNDRVAQALGIQGLEILHYNMALFNTIVCKNYQNISLQQGINKILLLNLRMTQGHASW